MNQKALCEIGYSSQVFVPQPGGVQRSIALLNSQKETQIHSYLASVIGPDHCQVISREIRSILKTERFRGPLVFHSTSLP